MLNGDDKYCRTFASESKCETRFVSGAGEADVYFDEKGIYRSGRLILPDSDIRIVGRHNRYNYCEAFAATEDTVSEEALCRVAGGFGGV